MSFCVKCDEYTTAHGYPCRCKSFQVYNLDRDPDEYLTVYAHGDEKKAAEKYAERDFHKTACEVKNWRLKINEKVFDVYVRPVPEFEATLVKTRPIKCDE